MRVSAIAVLSLMVLAIHAPSAVSQTSDWMRDTASAEYRARSRSFFSRACTDCDTAAVVAPRLLNLPEIRLALERSYPRALRSAGISGSVLVWMVVDSAGVAGRSEVGLTSRRPELDTAALAVVRRMRFSPARTRTGPTGSFVVLPVTFRIAELANPVGARAGNTPAAGAATPPGAAPGQDDRKRAAATPRPDRVPYRSAGWVELRRDSSVSVSIDTRAVRARGDTVLAWIEYQHSAAKAGQAVPYPRVLTWYAMFCGDRRITTLLIARHAADGSIVSDTGRMNNAFEAPAPGSSEAFIVQTVCTRYAPEPARRE